MISFIFRNFNQKGSNPLKGGKITSLFRILQKHVPVFLNSNKINNFAQCVKLCSRSAECHVISSQTILSRVHSNIHHTQRNKPVSLRNPFCRELCVKLSNIQHTDSLLYTSHLAMCAGKCKCIIAKL